MSFPNNIEQHPVAADAPDGARRGDAPQGAPGGGGGGDDFPGAGGQPHSQLDVRRLFGILRRRKILILGITLLATVASLLFAAQITPLYRAQAELLLAPDRSNVVDIPEVVQGLKNDWFTSKTEAVVVGSRELARAAVLRLDLERNPLYNRKLAPPQPSFLEASLRVLQGALAQLGLMAPPAPLRPRDAGDAPDPAEDPALLERLTGAYLSGLRVKGDERSRLIRVRYESPDPQMAALAANTTAELYIESRQRERAEGTGQAARFLQRQVSESQARLVSAQRELQRFLQEQGLQELEGMTLAARQLTNLESQLLQATTRRREAEARYNQALRLQRSPGVLESAGGVLGSPLVQNLLLQEVELNRRIAELATQYRAKHPKMINANAELQNLQQRISVEVAKVVANLRNELEVARVREASLREEVDRLRLELDRVSASEAEKRALETEVEINKDLYETLLLRLREVDVQEERPPEAEARIINPAITPGKPFYPRKHIIVGMAFAASLVIAVGLAFALELLDSGFNGLSQLEQQTGLPTLGMLPTLRMRKGEQPHQHAIDSQGSLFAESVRTLRTGLMLANAQTPPRVVVVASSVPDEGKTSTALSIGCQNVQAGRSSIVIDCDMRHPSISEALGYGRSIGLSDYLAGDAEVEDIVALDQATGLHFIGAGTGRVRPVELLASPRMQRLLQQLGKSHQMVVIDTPPLLAVSDALPLLREADATIFLVRWHKTARDTAKSGLKLALESGARLAGVVLTNVDVRRHAQYYDPNSRYYYHKSYRKYYAS